MTLEELRDKIFYKDQIIFYLEKNIQEGRLDDKTLERYKKDLSEIYAEVGEMKKKHHEMSMALREATAEQERWDKLSWKEKAHEYMDDLDEFFPRSVEAQLELEKNKAMKNIYDKI